MRLLMMLTSLLICTQIASANSVATTSTNPSAVAPTTALTSAAVKHEDLKAYDDLQKRGLEIAMRVIEADTGWNDVEVSMTMVLENAMGEKSLRDLSMKSMEVESDGDKSLLIINNPLDIKGTRLLNHSHALVADDQWIFIPSIKRTKRVSSKNKSGPFMGSEFAYEDLTSFELEKYAYRFLREEKLDGIDCEVVELIPQYKYSGYSRMEGWIDKERNVFLKTEFYDRKKSLLKTLYNSKHEKYLDKYWRPMEMTMQNHQNNKKTTISLQDYSFQVGLKGTDFNRNVLNKSRY
jgi:outer membrane lipoprotein-sorting protein